jgi:hypothetical protein
VVGELADATMTEREREREYTERERENSEMGSFQRKLPISNIYILFEF